MENCKKCADMFPKKRKNAYILLKSQFSARECLKCKIMIQIPRNMYKHLLGYNKKTQLRATFLLYS